MVGRPLTKINQTMSALLDAVQGGRETDAKTLLARLTRVCAEAGVPRPELPEEVMELAQSWLESVHHSPALPAEPTTDLDMDTRHVLIDVGQKAARRMQAMIDDDSAWGPAGWVEPRKQAETLHLMLGRAYGQMPSGARFLRLPDGTTGDRQVSAELDERMQVETIGLMVQRRVRNGRDQAEVVEVKADPNSSMPLHTHGTEAFDEKYMSTSNFDNNDKDATPRPRKRRNV